MRLILFSPNYRNSNWGSERLNNLMEVTGKRVTLGIVRCVVYTWGEMILYAPKEKLLWSDNPKIFHEKWLRRERKQMKGSSVEVYIRHMRGFSGEAAKSLQWSSTLCHPIDGSPPGSPVPGILQARTLECVAISFSNAWKWKNKVKSLSCVRLLATPCTAAYQAPPSMGFSRQQYWSGVPSSSPSLEKNDWKLWSSMVSSTWFWRWTLVI